MNRTSATLSLFISLSLNFISETRGQSAIITTKRNIPSGVVIVESSAVSEIFGENNFVDGYVEQRGDDFIVFPIGDNTKRRPFAAHASGTRGAYNNMSLQTNLTTQYPGTSISKDLSKISNREYWNISGSRPTKLTLTWDSESDVQGLVDGGDIYKVCIAGWNGYHWVKIESSIDAMSVFGEASNHSEGSVTTSSPIVPDQYEAYTLGAFSESSLPVTLSMFDAVRNENAVLLKWATSSEINSSHFEIEKSRDGKHWMILGSIKSTADEPSGINNYEFVDRNPFSGNNFYRLKLVDQDLTFTHSKISKVTIDRSDAQFAYPNPVSDRLYIQGFESYNEIKYDLIDQDGRVIKTADFGLESSIDVKSVRKGQYTLNIKFTDGSKSMKVIIDN